MYGDSDYTGIEKWNIQQLLYKKISRPINHNFEMGRNPMKRKQNLMLCL